jgi:hypothetical protein
MDEHEPEPGVETMTFRVEVDDAWREAEPIMFHAEADDAGPQVPQPGDLIRFQDEDGYVLHMIVTNTDAHDDGVGFRIRAMTDPMPEDQA